MDGVSAEDAVGYLIKRVQQAFRRRSDAELRGAGVSMAQYAVLRALADHPEATAAELARLCFVTRQSLQDVLSGLRSSGLVDSAFADTRGRSRALRLTDSGAQRLETAHVAVMGVESTMLHGISSAQRAELGRLLGLCAGNLEAH